MSEEHVAVENLVLGTTGDANSEQLRTLDPEWMQVCRQRLQPGLFPEHPGIVAEEEPDRRDPHRRAVTVGAAGKMALGDGPVIAALFHRAEHGPGAAPVAARGDVVGDERGAELLFEDLLMRHQRL